MRALIVSHLYVDPQRRGKLRALAGLGVDLLVAVPHGSAGLDAGVRFAPIGARGEVDRPDSLRWDPRALRRAVSDFHPDLLQIEEAPDTQAAAVAVAVARHLRVPYALFSWESLPQHRRFLAARRYRSILRHAAGVAGGNRLALELLTAGAPHAVAAVLRQTGVQPALTVPETPRPGLRIGFVGRLVPERGGETLLRACAQLLGPWTLAMAGTGPEQEALEALAQRLGLASRIRWLGGVPRDKLGALWGEIDCLAMPSQTTETWVERSSDVLLEAMARGIAPVVTAAGALPDLVGAAGVVVADGDALALALQELLANPERCRVLGRLARQRILEEYVDSAVAERTLAYWKQVVATARRLTA